MNLRHTGTLRYYYVNGFSLIYWGRDSSIGVVEKQEVLLFRYSIFNGRGLNVYSNDSEFFQFFHEFHSTIPDPLNLHQI